MIRPYFISAIGTPLLDNESLHVDGLRAHLEDQWQGGMDGVLVAGSMGAMQMLADQTYRDLLTEACRICQGRGEVLVGVGDAGWARTRDRVDFVNQLTVDGAVVLTPYLWSFTDDELVDYFHAVADRSRHPVYLYDLPALTRVKLDFETVAKAAQHPNIVGIKCSCEIDWTRQLVARMGNQLRVIVAQPEQVDTLIHEGVTEHLDGVFAMAPQWTAALGQSAAAGDWEQAAAMQQRITSILRLIRAHGAWSAFTAVVNARGIPGNFAPGPIRPLSMEAQAAVLQSPTVQELISAGPDSS